MKNHYKKHHNRNCYILDNGEFCFLRVHQGNTDKNKEGCMCKETRDEISEDNESAQKFAKILGFRDKEPYYESIQSKEDLIDQNSSFFYYMKEKIKLLQIPELKTILKNRNGEYKIILDTIFKICESFHNDHFSDTIKVIFENALSDYISETIYTILGSDVFTKNLLTNDDFSVAIEELFAFYQSFEENINIIIENKQKELEQFTTLSRDAFEMQVILLNSKRMMAPILFIFFIHDLFYAHEFFNHKMDY